MKTSNVAVLMSLLAAAIAFKFPDMFQPKVALKEFGEVKGDLRQILNSFDTGKLSKLSADGENLLQHYMAGSVSKQNVGKFKLKNCGDKKVEIVDIISLSILPDPLVLPGEMDVSFKISIEKNLDEPIKTVVSLSSKKQGTIPCIGQIGSCTYDDLCNILSLIPQCPDPFVQQGIPCQCPFNKGVYVLKKVPFLINVPAFAADDYSLVLNMTRNGVPVGCYEVDITISNS